MPLSGAEGRAVRGTPLQLRAGGKPMATYELDPADVDLIRRELLYIVQRIERSVAEEEAALSRGDVPSAEDAARFIARDRSDLARFRAVLDKLAQ